jgi:hypothetical protein
MVHHANWIILVAVGATLSVLIPLSQSEPPLEEGNPGLPGCLAEVAELQNLVGSGRSGHPLPTERLVPTR